MNVWNDCPIYLKFSAVQICIKIQQIEFFIYYDNTLSHIIWDYIYQITYNYSLSLFNNYVVKWVLFC